MDNATYSRAVLCSHLNGFKNPPEPCQCLWPGRRAFTGHRRRPLNELRDLLWTESSLQLVHTMPVPHHCVLQGAVWDRLSRPRLLTADMIMARWQFCFLTAGYNLSSGSNSPVYGGRLQAEGPSTTVLPLATDVWLRYHFRLLEGSLPLKGMQQTRIQRAAASERHFIPHWLWGPLTHMPCPLPTTSLCPNQTEIWVDGLVWRSRLGQTSASGVDRLSLHSSVLWGSKIKGRVYLVVFTNALTLVSFLCGIFLSFTSGSKGSLIWM